MKDQRNRYKSAGAHLRSNIVGYVAIFVALSISPVIAAATIGTSDIKKGAVTRPKIAKKAVNAKKIDDLAKRRVVGTSGAPNFTNGGEGDCAWVNVSTVIPGLSNVHFYKDHFGIVHMGGFAIGTDASGGDADCNSQDSGETEDGIAFRLPKAFRPAKHEIFESGEAVMIIVGKNPLVAGPTFLPAGAVFGASGTTPALVLDGYSYRTDSAAGSAAGLSSSELDAEAREVVDRILDL